MMRNWRWRSIKCPVCAKFVQTNDIERHLVACLTKPRVIYNDDVLREDKGECVICFEELLKGETIARLPCLCIYHKTCIDRWFAINRSCPEHPSNWPSERTNGVRYDFTRFEITTKVETENINGGSRRERNERSAFSFNTSLGVLWFVGICSLTYVNIALPSDRRIPSRQAMFAYRVDYCIAAVEQTCT